MKFIYWMIAFLLNTLLSGCVSYHPKPLDTPDLTKKLTNSDKIKLTQAAGALRHPRLPQQSLDFAEPLTPQELAIIAVLLNPDLKALRSKAQVADAQVFSAGLLPDPQINLEYDFLLHPGPGLSDGYLAGINWDVFGLILRRLKIKIAQKQSAQIRYDIAWQEWLVANQVEILAYHVYFLRQQIALSQKELLKTKKWLMISQRNLQRHDIRIDEWSLRKNAYLDLQDQIATLQRTLEKTQLQLNQLIGFSPEQKFPLAIKPVEIPAHLNVKILYKQAQTFRLDLLALQAGYASQEMQVYQAVLGQFPGFTLGTVLLRDTTFINTLGPTLTFNLPVFNRNRGVIAVAAATREQLYQEYLARLHQTLADIAALVADLKKIQQEEAILTRGLPDLEKSERLMRVGYHQGDVALANYETVRTSLLNKELKLLMLQQDATDQIIGLQLSCGKIACWEIRKNVN